MSPPRPALNLFLVSGLILFLELALIRWLPAHVLFLTFFTNTVLLASFVGMCVGCLLADRPRTLLRDTPAWLAGAVVTGWAMNLLRKQFERHVDVANQANPEVVFFGTEVNAFRQVEFRVPVELVMGLFFVLAAAVMVGPGQELGRAFARVPGRARGYGLNLLGSLAGIGAFAGLSWFQVPAVAWFAVAAVGVGYFLRGQCSWASHALLTAAVLAAVPTSGLVPSDAGRTHWSPYYRIDFHAHDLGVVTNLIGHQKVEPRADYPYCQYALPHLFQRDVPAAAGGPAWPPFKRVLVIGAGTGNDLARATQWCPPDARIDAVDIDPVIMALGREHNPDRPYQDPRVTAHLNDGRNFLRQAPAGEYDLVVFALIDSLVLHTGYSNLRLESYLFTAEAFRDVRRVLKPTGVAAVYNYFRQGWVAVRLAETLRAEFGAAPVVLTAPAKDEIKADEFQYDMFTAFFAGAGGAVDPLRAAFAGANNSYWLPANAVITPATPGRFTPSRPDGGEWVRLRAAEVEPAPADLPKATDDWPFLYTRKPTVPDHTLKGVGITLLLAVGLWAGFAKYAGPPPASRATREFGLMSRAFWLGAGFMLIETKAVVHMALLFGSTWTVNTAVFAAVLLMSLAGNLFAGWAKPKHLLPYYVGLFAAIAANVAVSPQAFLGYDPTTQVVAACGLTFAPIAFAGVIFATTFGRARSPGKVFGANVAGALVGGLAENASMLVGFQHLGVLAGVFYLLSAWGGSSDKPSDGV